MLSLQPLIAAVLVMAASALATGFVCEKGYVQEDAWCYMLDVGGDTFINADQTCKREKGNLVSIHSLKENTLVASLGENLLIGLQYNPETKNYSWTDGTPFDMANWEDNYPMNPDFYGYCVLIQKSGKWINNECKWNAHFVCKKDAVANECPLPPDNQFFMNGEVTSPRYPGNYSSGQTCSYMLLAKNDHSVTIEFDEMRLSHMDDITIYSGLVPNPDFRIAYIFDSLTNLPMAYTTRDLENKMLVIFKSHSGTGGYWKFHFSSTAGCKQEYFNGGDVGLNYCYSFEERPNNYADSDYACTCKNTHLLSIQNAFHNAYIAKLMERMAGWHIWLGLSYYSKSWKWADGNAVQYSNWNPGEPNRSKGNCAWMTYGGKWESASCDDRANTVCMYKP